MLAGPGPLPFGAGWSFELKWDGFRAIVSTEDGLHVRSRRGWNMTAAMRELAGLPPGYLAWVRRRAATRARSARVIAHPANAKRIGVIAEVHSGAPEKRRSSTTTPTKMPPTTPKLPTIALMRLPHPGCPASSSYVGRELDGCLDDDRNIERQRGYARRGARVHSGVSPKVEDQVAEAVDYVEGVGEIGSAVDIADCPQPSTMRSRSPSACFRAASIESAAIRAAA